MTMEKRFDKLESLIKELSLRMDAKFEMIVKEVERQVSRHSDECDEKYANKWSERVIIGLVSVILAAFMALLIYKVGWQT